MRKTFLLILLPLFVVWGCSDEPPKPDNLINEKKYIDLMVELQLVRSFGETTQADSATVDSLTAEVFKKYNTTESAFQQSHNYYQHFPKQQLHRIEKAIEQLKMDQVVKTQEQGSVNGDTLRSK